MKANNNNGFSLVELMIVVAIISILAAVAYPSYQNYVRKGHRSDGKAALLVAGQQMERFFTESMSYNGAPLNATVSPQQFYTIAFDSSPTGGTVCGATSSSTTNNTAFRLCATPVGTQASDTCGVLSLSNTGARTPTTAGCW